MAPGNRKKAPKDPGQDRKDQDKNGNKSPGRGGKESSTDDQRGAEKRSGNN